MWTLTSSTHQAYQIMTPALYFYFPLAIIIWVSRVVNFWSCLQFLNETISIKTHHAPLKKKSTTVNKWGRHFCQLLQQRNKPHSLCDCKWLVNKCCNRQNPRSATTRKYLARYLNRRRACFSHCPRIWPSLISGKKPHSVNANDNIYYHCKPKDK